MYQLFSLICNHARLLCGFLIKYEYEYEYIHAVAVRATTCCLQPRSPTPLGKDGPIGNETLPRLRCAILTSINQVINTQCKQQHSLHHNH